MAVYIQLFTEDNNITSYVDAYLLLQDAYELKDSNTYAMLINMLKNSIVELFAQNKQVEIIKLLKIKDSEEISSLFNALENNNQSKIDNIIIDLTLRKMNLYFYGKNSSNGQHFVKNHSHNSLWNKSNAESDYYVDTAEFRIKVYKKNGFSKDNIMELDPLNNLSLFTEHRWFITHYTRFSKEELEKKFDTVLELYQASLLSELNDHQKTIENKAIRKRLLDYIELKNNAEKCAELVNIDLKLLNYAYQHKLQAKVYYLLGFNYKEIAMADYLFSKHNSQSLIKLFLLQHLDFSDNYFYCFSVLEREHSSLLFKREVFQFLGLNEDIPEFTKPNLSLLENEADISKLQLWFKNEAKVMSSYMLYCSANNIHKSDWIDFIEEISNYFNTPNNQQNIFLTQRHLS